MIEKDKILELLQAGDAWQASGNLMKILMNKEEREELFRKFLEVENDVSSDWFQKFYSDEMEERTKKKQYFTPGFLANLVSKLAIDEKKKGLTNFDVAAGTGALTVAKWNTDRMQVSPLTYKPSDYLYIAEELKIENQPARALPFLLFNFLIRGMNGIVIAGDSLERKVSQVYFIQNDKDNFLGFSSLNVMPRTELVEKEFDVRTWIDEPIEHIESTDTLPSFILNKLTGVEHENNQKEINKFERFESLINNFKSVDEMIAERKATENRLVSEYMTKINEAVKNRNEFEALLKQSKAWKLRNRDITKQLRKLIQDKYADVELINDNDYKIIKISYLDTCTKGV